ncbi:MAG: hypothetical protein WAL66_19290, partial [Nitrososphaeraceae archaeon]
MMNNIFAIALAVAIGIIVATSTSSASVLGATAVTGKASDNSSLKSGNMTKMTLSGQGSQSAPYPATASTTAGNLTKAGNATAGNLTKAAG